MCVFVIWCCGVLCCVVMCDVGAGVGVQCEVCGVCSVCSVLSVLSVLSVCGAAWHAEKPPCVDSKRPRVYVQNVSVYASNTRTCFSACGRGTHRDVLNLHTGKREEGVLFSLSLSF